MRYLLVSALTATLMLACALAGGCSGGGHFCAFGICNVPSHGDIADISPANYTGGAANQNQTGTDTQTGAQSGSSDQSGSTQSGSTDTQSGSGGSQSGDGTQSSGDGSQSDDPSATNNTP
jgi:hypothetical protein